MTDGVVLVLGKVGLNFGAGFTGGLAYVLDIERDFVDRYNHELIDIHRVSAEGFENHRQHLHTLISRHRELTGSIWAQQIWTSSATTSASSGWSNPRPPASSR